MRARLAVTAAALLVATGGAATGATWFPGLVLGTLALIYFSCPKED